MKPNSRTSKCLYVSNYLRFQGRCVNRIRLLSFSSLILTVVKTVMRFNLFYSFKQRRMVRVIFLDVTSSIWPFEIFMQNLMFFKTHVDKKCRGKTSAPRFHNKAQALKPISDVTVVYIKVYYYENVVPTLFSYTGWGSLACPMPFMTYR